MKLPRFTLRDLFWLVLVAAMGCAWCLDHWSLKSDNTKLIRAIGKAAFGIVPIDGEYQLMPCWANPEDY